MSPLVGREIFDNPDDLRIHLYTHEHGGRCYLTITRGPKGNSKKLVDDLSLASREAAIEKVVELLQVVCSGFEDEPLGETAVRLSPGLIEVIAKKLQDCDLLNTWELESAPIEESVV